MLKTGNNAQALELVLDCENGGECDTDGSVDIDLCTDCKDHASFCSVCGLSACCGAGQVNTDFDFERD